MPTHQSCRGGTPRQYRGVGLESRQYPAWCTIELSCRSISDMQPLRKGPGELGPPSNLVVGYHQEVSTRMQRAVRYDTPAYTESLPQAAVHQASLPSSLASPDLQYALSAPSPFRKPSEHPRSSHDGPSTPNTRGARGIPRRGSGRLPGAPPCCAREQPPQHDGPHEDTARLGDVLRSWNSPGYDPG